jgi:Sushi repeat (SCR repeat)
LTDGIWTSCFDIAQNGTMFSVQLAERVKVSAIRMVFQNHQHFQRMNVFVDEQTCHYNGQLPETGALELHCTQQPMGSRLRIQIWSLQFPLAICEVQAFSTESENKLCGTPVPPLNGFIRDGTADEFRFSCHSNFVLVGSEVTRCVDGRWTHETPKCVSNNGGCAALPNLHNGHIAYDKSPVENRYPNSTTATYFCSDRYNFIGNGSRYCRDDGTWSGDDSFCQCEE